MAGHAADIKQGERHRVDDGGTGLDVKPEGRFRGTASAHGVLQIKIQRRGERDNAKAEDTESRHRVLAKIEEIIAQQILAAAGDQFDTRQDRHQQAGPGQEHREWQAISAIAQQQQAEGRKACQQRHRRRRSVKQIRPVDKGRKQPDEPRDDAE